MTRDRQPVSEEKHNRLEFKLNQAEARIQSASHSMSRRQFLRTSLLSSGLVLAGLERLAAQTARPHIAGAKLLGVLPFEREVEAPIGVPIATELDQRMYTDLSLVSPEHPITASRQFYIRTGASQLLPTPADWRIEVDGLVEEPTRIEISTLRRQARSMGVHLMECAGNTRVTHFGLISVARWTGVPAAEVLDSLHPRREATRVTITGFDDYAAQSFTSVPGASWSFSLEQLKAAGAFLATGMNAGPLPRDHGDPVRLVVPGWYGCCAIKWITGISFTDDQAESTTQMREYAGRILQDGAPMIAAEFAPATIDVAAMPVRVEKWQTGASSTEYRITGVLWGGSSPARTLEIRFNPDEEFVPVEQYQTGTGNVWTIWKHTWHPASPGTYAMQLMVADPGVRARKMDAGYYVRYVVVA